MDASELDHRLMELRTRLAKLGADDQERALDGFAQVLNVLALPRSKDEAVSLSIRLDRGENIEYPSGERCERTRRRARLTRLEAHVRVAVDLRI
jgi:hypothetical protein